jgi:hypothetical protein
MRALLIVIALIGVASASAAREALLKDGLSPDKQLGAYLVSPDHPEAGAADFPSIVVRRERDQSVVGIFTAGSYMAYFDPAYERTKIAWSADSRFVAILSQSTKTTYDASVYHVTDQRLDEVPLPEYGRPLFDRLGIPRGGRYFLLERASWRDDQLELRVRGNVSDSSSNPKDFPDDWYDCTVVFEVESPTKVLLHEIIVSKSPKQT